jgi:hypothetical protein
MPALIQYSHFGAKIYNRLVKQYPRLEIRQNGKQLNKGDWQQDDSV